MYHQPKYSMCYLRKHCAMCKKIIDNSSNYITVIKDGNYVYFHRFCYFNYRMNDQRILQESEGK